MKKLDDEQWNLKMKLEKKRTSQNNEKIGETQQAEE